MLCAQGAPFRCAPRQGRLCIVQAATKGFGAKPKAVPKPKKDNPAPEPCPCDSGKAYKNCCGAVHRGETVAATPEATLRARFSAFVKGEADYLITTTHPDYHVNHYQVPIPGGAVERLREDVAGACNKFAFTGLRVVGAEPGVNEYEGYVSFEYLSRKRSAPGAPVTEEEVRDTTAWSRTAERCRFLRTSSGTWQFVDYQTATFDSSMLGGLQEQQPAAM
ncbi:hypothetical protein VOLCADRAFT_102602 [Volvox carteri f. nagariensis]|uniref:YchJ-like middle NTF2-like domain-containing protein n=1 Tax=Volvox carteri f. nagariensis TaxID=3068 RepID=D8TGZ1_VOLCA|nr:uncharacterized protein VOLCADRAFT_102602 [Volvox carteri f. nagariensis]EFJ52981.1 hypothetical protein VOLCADRAFT_102602 [Volvox carteri f. nagariensis]|eukprot:XP_002945986.1 hypothetical protein VOLCADRAFT_102602 [Volvox carteri f. nagariensis]